jgi:hypothetical protein
MHAEFGFFGGKKYEIEPSRIIIKKLGNKNAIKHKIFFFLILLKLNPK